MSYTRFNKYITNELFFIQKSSTSTSKSFRRIKNGQPTYEIDFSGSTTYAAQKFCIGMVYLILNQCNPIFFPADYILTPGFAAQNMLYKLLYITIWGKLEIIKYLGVWQLCESSLAISGISYNGNVDGENLWNGLVNCRPGIFEKVTSLTHIIESFNVNTNLFSKNYVFKRMRFLGNKHLSSFGTLMFLAIW